MADMEKLTVFNAIRGYLREEDQKALAEKLGLDDTLLSYRLAGLKNEDEFYLMLLFLQVCEHMIALDEGVSILTNSNQPDMLIKSKNGEIIFIEIKGTHEKTFRISGGNLRKRMEFANGLGFPLYFAIKLDGYWTLFDSQYLQSKSGKITLLDDYINSEFNTKFNSQIYIFPKGLKLETEYSFTEGPIYEGITHPQYGNLISYKLTFEEKVVLEANKSDTSKISTSFVLEGVRDVMSIQSQQIQELDNGNTLIIEKLTDDIAIPDYALLLATINHIISDFGFTYDSTTFFKMLLERKQRIFTQEIVQNVILDLKGKGVRIESTYPDRIDLR